MKGPSTAWRGEPEIIFEEEFLAELIRLKHTQTYTHALSSRTHRAQAQRLAHLADLKLYFAFVFNRKV